MAQRLTPSSPQIRSGRPRGRPRKDGTPPRARASSEPGKAQERPQRRPMLGDNVTDKTRLEYLERGRLAYVEAMRQKEHYQSAWRVYSQLVKDARKVGATEIAWTLEALRRDPLDVEREITERVRMAKLTNLPLGFQLAMFAFETDEPVKGRDVAESATSYSKRWVDTSIGPEDILTVQEAVLERSLKETVEYAEPQVQAGNGAVQGDAKSAEESPPKPPVREPDDEPDPDEPDEADEDEPDEDEEEAQAAKAGNEMLEKNDDDARAYLQGGRAFLLGRTTAANPYPEETTMNNAWIRGWKEKELATAAR